MRQRLWLCSVVVVLVASGSLLGGPSDKDPLRPFETFGGAKVQALVKAADELSRSIAPAMDKLEQDARGQTLGKVPAKIWSDTWVDIYRLTRIAERISEWNETAGVDYRLRASWFLRSHNRLFLSYMSTPLGLQETAKVRSTYQRNNPRRDQSLKMLSQLVRQENWEAADTLLNESEDWAESFMVFCDAERTAFMTPYVEAARQIRPPALSKRLEEVRVELVRFRDQQTVDSAQWVSYAAASTSGIRSTGRFSENGQDLTGPQLIHRLMDQWQILQLSTLRRRAAEWALERVGKDTLADASVQEVKDMAHEQYLAGAKLVVQALCKVIEADAERANSDEVPSLYFAYLEALSPWVGRTCDRMLLEPATVALAKLSQKNPAFDAECLGYRRATDEVIRWRARAAESLATRKATEFPVAADKLRSAATSSADRDGLFFPPPYPDRVPSLLASAPKVLSDIVPNLLAQKVTVQNVVAYDAMKAIGRYERGNYAVISLPGPVRSEIDALRLDLLATAERPPLSLLAASAILSAETGCYDAVGGTIRSIYLDSHLTRFATLTHIPAYDVLTSLGALPADPYFANRVPEVVVRFTIQPVWLRHQCFLVAVP